MKSTILTFFLVISLATTALAQTAENSIAKASYTLKHIKDTTNRDSVYIENMVLYVGQNSSVFMSYDKALQITAIEKDLENQRQQWTGPGLPIFKSMPGTRKTTNLELYQFPQEKKIFTKEYLMRNYLYEEPLDEIKWTLINETKNFDKISTQKATANIRGREWVVWFATDIPFETGPWKLHGLPGLIIEAYDNKKEVQFLFAGFETINQTEKNNIFSIELPKEVLKVTLKEINKLKEAMYKSPRDFYMAQAQLMEGKLDAKEMAGFSTKKINNPIDLTQNK